MQKYSEHILHSLNSPYNIHILNLVNSISSVDVSNLNQFEINLNNTFKDIAKTLKDIHLDDHLLESPPFLLITTTIQNYLDQTLNSDTIEKLPNNLTIIVCSFKKVVSTFININKNKDGTQVFNYALELLEDAMEKAEQDNVKHLFFDVINDNDKADKLWNIFIDFSASMYGLLASIPSTSKWNDIIADKDVLLKLIDSYLDNIPEE